MTRRERLMATLRGEPVDRPAVCFYELNGLDERLDDPDPYNIYSHPSWRPLIELTRERTDRIVMRGVPFVGGPEDPVAALATTVTEERAGSRFTTTTIRAGARVLTQRTRRDRDVNTVWTIEPLLKGVDDVRAYLDLPLQAFGGRPDTSRVESAEARLGDAGIVMIDTPDPLCCAAALFDMAEYTVVAMTEPALFRRLLDRFATLLLPRTEAVARALPGRLWRLYGPEYASPPYLPPACFRDYVVAYDTPMVAAIQRHGGYARIHSHGRLDAILGLIAATGAVGLDPIEPPPQGDLQLGEVRRRVGRQMVLFGNLEISDIENLPVEAMAARVRTALEEGTAGPGRGFVLMPSACPYGRVVSPRTQRNYEAIVRLVAG